MSSSAYNLYVGITCSDGDIRLVDGQFPSEGRVEVCVEEQFGTVCDFGWDSVDAGVVCRQLQYSGEGLIKEVSFTS